MIQPHIAAESGILLAQLADAAARSLALAAVAGLALAIFRVKATSARLFTWTTVLYAALAIPLLGWVLPSLPIPMPSLVQSTASHLPNEAVTSDVDAVINAGHWSGNTVRNVQPPEESSLEKHPAVSGSTILVQHPQPLPHSAVPISWRTAASVVYLLVALSLMVRLAIGIGLTQRLVKTSEHINDPRLRSKLAYRSYANGLSFLTEVRESTAISVPVTVGPIRSTILLPASWREWDEEKLDAVIAHEMSHVSRYDALTQCAALLHRAVFWFSPLSWWLNRHIADLAEQASDEAALCGGADRTHYARTLLQFFETLHGKPRRVWWQGVSMANAGQAEKRLEKILGWRGAVTMRFKKSAAVVIVALAVPVVFLAASAQPTSLSTIASTSQEPPPPPPASTQAVPAQPAPPPAEGLTVAPMPGAPGHRVISGVPAPFAPIAGIPAVPAMPATPAHPGVPGARDKHGFHYSYDFDDEERFVIVSANSDSVTMSGSSQDVRHAQKLRKQIPGDFIWFQRDEKSYIVRDQATIDRARKLWAPQEELGKKQEELGKQQEALGKQQEELGARMEKVHVKVPDLTAQVDKLRAELKSLSSGATQEQIGKLQSEIGELQSQLGEVQSHAGDQQGKLGEEMGALGEKQGKLGEQQGELGRQQAELAEKATQEMKQILDEAIKNGTAKPEPGETGRESL
jgi:beta-lactamase regulating signal transducer with metallopeptidase domain